jgi:hypothetical protein
MAVTQTPSWQEAFFWGKGIERYCALGALFPSSKIDNRLSIIDL